MLRVSFIIVLIISATSYLHAQNGSDSLTVEIKVKKEHFVTHSKKFAEVIYRYENLDITKDSVTEKRFEIELIIKNVSKSSKFIWLMSCSWEDNFFVNNNYIFIAGHDCDKNIPTIVEIKPNESKIYNTVIVKSIKFDYPCKNCFYGQQVEETKLGLVLISDITKRDYVDYTLNMEDKSKWKIIWSNSLLLLGKQPEPKTINIYKN
jgi:hypothetical protein